MRWIIEKTIAAEIEPAKTWAKMFLSSFEISRLDWIRIDTGRGTHVGAYGRCWYPTGRKGYRISIQVPGPFPYQQTRYTTPLYRDSAGNWPDVPPDRQPAGCIRDPRSGREWLRLTTQYEMSNRVEGVVHVAAHEFFHFLRHSRQIPGRNSETEADRFAVDQLARFRADANFTS
jgi:hypothetical protein